MLLAESAIVLQDTTKLSRNAEFTTNLFLLYTCCHFSLSGSMCICK